jgi:hypothetical protein
MGIGQVADATLLKDPAFFSCSGFRKVHQHLEDKDRGISRTPLLMPFDRSKFLKTPSASGLMALSTVQIII